VLKLRDVIPISSYRGKEKTVLIQKLGVINNILREYYIVIITQRKQINEIFIITSERIFLTIFCNLKKYGVKKYS
jgi:hypothetical protein